MTLMLSLTSITQFPQYSEVGTPSPAADGITANNIQPNRKLQMTNVKSHLLIISINNLSSLGRNTI